MMDRPIIFSGPMIRALLDGRKTMTRRVLKPQPNSGPNGEMVHLGGNSWGLSDGILSGEWNTYAPGDRLWCREAITRFDKGTCDQWVWYRAGNNFGGDYMADHRWIKEHFPEQGENEEWRAAEGPAGGKPYNVPSIHMPRWASRLTLTVTAVKVERLQDISEEDAQAEGVERLKSRRGYYSAQHGRAAVRFGVYHDYAKEAFEDLWTSIHGPGAWEANPWVAAITFTVERRNIDAPTAPASEG